MGLASVSSRTMNQHLLVLLLPALALSACSKGTPSAEPSAAADPADAAKAAETSPDAAASDPHRYDVTFESHGLHLRGWVVRTPGAHPRPVLVYNHGSAKDVAWSIYGDMAAWLSSRGYVVFFPFRRGVEGSEGEYLDDEADRSANPDHARTVVEHLVSENDDVSAAIAWIRSQPYADGRRVAVAGCSYGGIEALLSAEREIGIYAAVDFAGGAASWASSPFLQERMTLAAEGARVPVMFVQAKNDFSTAPSEVLAAAMRGQGKDAELRIYPPRGSSALAGHAFCVSGLMTWGEDVLSFLAAKAPR
jgi:dipeptidyl aminopeptidase/acylaminoacyl peptidase